MTNDPDLNMISELRSPSAGPSPEVARREREHLMCIAHETQAARTTPRRTAAMIGAAAVSVLAIGGIAAATGLIPDSVTDRFTDLEQRDTELMIDSDAAVMVASGQASSASVELWVAPAGGDGECEYVRSSWTPASGGDVISDGPIACGQPLQPWTVDGFEPTDPGDYLGSLDVFPVGSTADGFQATAITGSAHPAVHSIEIELADETRLSVKTIDDQGWFATIDDGDTTQADALGLPSNPAVGVILLDENGAQLAQLTDWTRYQAQAIPAEN